MFFENRPKLDQTLAMPVMPVGTDRIIDIADVSASQGALHYGYAMPVMPGHRRNRKRLGKGHCTIDIVDVFGVPSPTG